MRSIEVIKASLALSDTLVFHIRTLAPRWLFDRLPAERLLLYPIQLDAGAVQSNSFAVEKAKTLSLYADLIRQKEKLICREVDFLQEKSIDLVVSDITPFAFDAAAEAGLPSLGIGNFSWDWIYGDWIASYPEFQYVIDDIRASYGKASLLFRLPFHGDMSAFRTTMDVPLIGRRASRSNHEILRSLDWPAARQERAVLLALRDADMRQVNWNKVRQLADFHFLTLSNQVEGENITSLKEGVAPFEDLLSVCAAVISKPGYSIVSECIVNRTPILYVPRSDFAEDPILRKGLRDYAVCEEMRVQDFFDGNWQAPLTSLFGKPALWKDIRADGAKVIAGKLLAL